jgi:hypothetical protein
MAGGIAGRVIDQVVLPAADVRPGSLVISHPERAFCEWTPLHGQAGDARVLFIVVAGYLSFKVGAREACEVYRDDLGASNQPIVNEAILQIIVHVRNGHAVWLL